MDFGYGAPLTVPTPWPTVDSPNPPQVATSAHHPPVHTQRCAIHLLLHPAPFITLKRHRPRVRTLYLPISLLFAVMTTSLVSFALCALLLLSSLCLSAYAAVAADEVTPPPPAGPAHCPPSTTAATSPPPSTAPPPACSTTG